MGESTVKIGSETLCMTDSGTNSSSLKILLVEDDPQVERYLTLLLEKKGGYLVIRTSDGSNVLELVAQSTPNLILLDVVLNETDGIVLCHRLKRDPRTNHIPLILFSGVRKNVLDQVCALELGADDYLLKPIDPDLLLSKIRTVLRRYSGATNLQKLICADQLTLDTVSWTVTVQGQVVNLTRKEFELLLALVKYRGQVLTPAYLLESIWGYDSRTYKDYRTVKVHISSLRTKLGPEVGRKIVAVRGVGYKFVIPS